MFFVSLFLLRTLRLSRSPRSFEDALVVATELTLPDEFVQQCPILGDMMAAAQVL